MHLRFLIGRIFRDQPLRFSLAVVTMAIGGLAEGVGIAAIIPLFQIIEQGGNAGGGVQGTAAAMVTWVLHLFGIPLALWSVLAFVLVFILANQAVLLAQAKISAGSTALFEARLRDGLFSSMMDAGWPLFVRTKSGDIISALFADTVRSGMAYASLVSMLGTIVIVVVYFALAVLLSWQMTLTVSAVAVLVIVVLRRRAAWGTDYGERLRETDADIYHETQENLTAAKLVKAYAAEHTVETRFTELTAVRQRIQYKNSMNQAWLRVLYDSVSITGVFVSIYLGVRYFGMTSAALIVFLFVFYRLSPRISGLQSSYSLILSLIPSLRSVDQFKANADAQREKEGALSVPEFQRGVRFKDVSFSYDSDKPLLHDINMDIPKGRRVAIVGPSGSGKTTLVDLLMGLMVPEDGDILIDDVSLKDVKLLSWRRQVGYVPQDAAFFHSSVRDNIAWGSETATVEQIVEAAKLAFAHEFVTELPQGYDTIIGDRGVRLSGGQRQRLALARAIVRRPSLLVLDEATSALDAESEDKIHRAVDRLAESTTVVTVTHRLSTVKGSDLIYVVEHGELIESGSWDELVAREGRFNELRELQGLG
jgi:ATP-binding cassette subfamily C protein